MQVIALASGKGGAGKTQLCLNLGIAIAHGAAHDQRLVVKAEPEARSSTAIHGLARMLVELPAPAGPRGDIEFFVENLLNLEG